MRTPISTSTVRVDAGFVAGDEVSSHYDPMIAKLIVRGATRDIAIQKLHAALTEYEIAGPITNVEFLKKVCETPAFIAGDVETGFISKWRKDLFDQVIIAPEVYVQAALGMYLLEATTFQNGKANPPGIRAGFMSNLHGRLFHFIPNRADGTTDAAETVVELKHISTGLFDVKVDGNAYNSVASQWDSSNLRITSYFPHTRLETRIISDGGNLTLFQQGQQYRLRCATPKWIEKALGIKDIAHSVLAPMPCKILSVQVAEGDIVKKDQPLVVIESMKMETVIRSPQDGVVSRVVHRQGVSLEVDHWFPR